jgi:hypothetical protein
MYASETDLLIPTTGRGGSERQGITLQPFPHSEQHTQHGAIVRDTIIGFADGLTVPFALTAALSR